MNQPAGGEHAPLSRLSDSELGCIWSVITAGLSKSEGMVHRNKSDVREGFPVEASSDVFGPSAGSWSDQA